MSTAPIRDIRKITGRIGAEVIGIDITAPIDEPTLRFVREALDEHKALVFRGAPLDGEGQQRFAAQLGELTTAHPTVASVEGAPRGLPVASQTFGGLATNHWPTFFTVAATP